MTFANTQLLDGLKGIRHIRCGNNVSISHLPSTQVLLIDYQLFLHVVKDNAVSPILVMSAIWTIIWIGVKSFRWRS